MRICLGVHQFRNVGGMEKFSLRLAQFLVARGHHVEVVAGQGQPMEGVDLLEVNRHRPGPRCARDWRSARRLASALGTRTSEVILGEQKMWNCDILRPAGGVEDEYWKVHHCFSRWRMDVAPWCRYLLPKRHFDVAAERAGFHHPRLRRIIVNSRLMRSQILGTYPGLADRTEVIHEGVNTQPLPRDLAAVLRKRLLLRHGLRADGVNVIFVGHDFRRKGLRFVIEALARARAEAPDWPLQLLVAGRDRARPYEQLASRLGVGASVAFVGSISPPDPCFAAGDVLVLPTFYDPCANVVMEALGFGMPAITSRANGAAEIIDSGHSGWILERPGDVDGLAGCLLALREPGRLAAMKESAQVSASRHPLDDKLRQVEAVLVAVAEEKRHAARIAAPAEVGMAAALA